MKSRYIGIDPHANSFTACTLQEGDEDIIQTFSLPCESTT